MHRKNAKLVTKNGRSARLASTTKTTPIIRCCRKPTARWRICAVNWPIPKRAWRSGRDLEAVRHLRGFAARLALAGGLFRKLSLSRKDFAARNGGRLMTAKGRPAWKNGHSVSAREPAFANRLSSYANVARFGGDQTGGAGADDSSAARTLVFPPCPSHLDAPRASLRVVCEVRTAKDHSALHACRSVLTIRPRTGEKFRPLSEIIDLTNRAAHDRNSFPKMEVIQWLAETYGDKRKKANPCTDGLELLQWLARWDITDAWNWDRTAIMRLKAIARVREWSHLSVNPPGPSSLSRSDPFPDAHLRTGTRNFFTHRLSCGWRTTPLHRARFFAGRLRWL